ncbi:MAG: type II toxin-antitoxin system RelE/ParE family toxin [Bacteroidetes bacterium]|nr:type II toxin-antitoxin system RelE/ParE family toxin [Bacteroidota bacterium]
MAYEIIVKPSAQKDLDSLPDKEVLHISSRIQNLSEEPRPIGVQKLTGTDGYRIRAGNYRILYEISDKGKEILIYRIKHRKDVYK